MLVINIVHEQRMLTVFILAFVTNYSTQNLLTRSKGKRIILYLCFTTTVRGTIANTDEWSFSQSYQFPPHIKKAFFTVSGVQAASSRIYVCLSWRDIETNQSKLKKTTTARQERVELREALAEQTVHITFFIPTIFLWL